jgi:hypothetical protein
MTDISPTAGCRYRPADIAAWEAEIELVRPFFSIVKGRMSGRYVMTADLRAATGNPKAILRKATIIGGKGTRVRDDIDELMLQVFVETCRLPRPDGKTSIDLIKEWLA